MCILSGKSMIKLGILCLAVNFGVFLTRLWKLSTKFSLLLKNLLDGQQRLHTNDFSSYSD